MKCNGYYFPMYAWIWNLVMQEVPLTNINNMRRTRVSWSRFSDLLTGGAGDVTAIK